MTSWWTSDAWQAYEQICGVPIPRAQELASATWATQVIDLTQDEATLWRDLRKSYKSLIHQAERRYTITEATPLDILFACRALHWLEAGRATRPIASWCAMAEWIATGHAKAFVARLSPEHVVGFVYVYTSGSWAYYGHAACAVPNVNHALVWTAIVACKAAGVQHFEAGWQGYAPPNDGIEQFRRGFGGRSVTFQELADLLRDRPQAFKQPRDVEQRQQDADHDQIHGGRL